MQVAIIGAGLSGLTCAHELERNGINTTIFEQNSFIGDIESHVTACINIMNRPIKDIINYLDSNFDIKIDPINTVNTLTHHSPNKTTIIKGSLGYFFKRNNENDSLLAQLHSQLKSSQVIFNHYADYEKLKNEFEYIVIANGNSNYTDELGCWQQKLSGWIKGAEVLGNLDPNEIVMWINKDYSNKGYAYLTPFSEKKASLCLFVPHVSSAEIDNYWELFLYSENIKYPIVEEFKKLHHSGLVYPHKFDNIYFVGSAGASVDTFMGFGQVDSMLQGVYAAQSIANGLDIDKLLEGSIQDILNKWEFRKAFDKATNDNYDTALTIMGFPPVKHLIYKTPFNIIKVGSEVLRFELKAKSYL